MSENRDRIILAVAGVALAGAAYAVYRSGRSFDEWLTELGELTNPYSLGPNGDGTTGNVLTDVLKGTRQLTTRPGDIPAAVSVASGNLWDQIMGTISSGVDNVINREPRGLRNNNPGNMRISNNPWQGKIGNDGAFEVFDTMANGLRANMINLYSRAVSIGSTPWDTIGQVIAEWAPSSENDTDAYISFVERETGYPRNAILDPRNSYQMAAVLRAIVLHENGPAAVERYAPELIPITLYQEAWRQGLQGRL